LKTNNQIKILLKSSNLIYSIDRELLQIIKFLIFINPDDD